MTIQFRTLISLTLSFALAWGTAVWAQEKGAAAPAPEDVNIAAAKSGGKIVYASSEFDKDWGAANLIDGEVWEYDPKTKTDKGSNGWASKSWELVSPNPAERGPNLGVGKKSEEVVIAFKDDQIRPIGRIVINPRTPDPLFLRGVRIFEMQISTQTPQGPWRSIGRAEVPQKADISGKWNYSYNISPPVQARYVKVIFIANWGSDRSVACGEIEIYPPGNDASIGVPGTFAPGTPQQPLTAADLLKFFMDMKPEERSRFIADLERLLNALKGGVAQSPPNTSKSEGGTSGTGGSGKQD